MKAVVIFSLICACTALPQFFLADTPEVQAEKQRFYQLYNAAAAAAAAAPDIHIYSQRPAQVVHQQQPVTFQTTHRFDSTPQVHHAPQPQYTTTWTGPLAATIPAGLPGSTPVVRNTPEVEAAIADFTRAYNAAVIATRSNVAQQTPFGNVQATYRSSQPQFTSPQVTQQRWTGPFAATIPAGLPGSGSQVQDTAEVLAAKAQFAQAYNQQLAHTFG